MEGEGYKVSDAMNLTPYALNLQNEIVIFFLDKSKIIIRFIEIY